ncbi:MAG TPA: DUF2723 domain-containing protein [Gemmatimonadaceae bacterium]|nr:DUF2723 domain-containing protein [Gemmatimonadaceae bacterium]
MGGRHGGRAARAAGGARAGPGRAAGGRSADLTPRRAAWVAGAALLVLYALTLAPSVTFWDAGELIAAAHALGIPHPPGTPLYVALAHAWSTALAPLFGFARATNLLSAACTAGAGAATAWTIARRVGGTDGGWTGAIGGLAAGTMMSAWSNATESEVYALALLHAVLMLLAAARAGEEDASAGDRWTLVTAYAIALAPASHLSVLVAAPAAIVLAARRPRLAGSAARAAPWRIDRVLMLGGVLVASAGVGRMQWPIVLLGAAIAASAVRGGAPRARRLAVATLPIFVIGCSALLVLLVRARLEPAIDQGSPSTLHALADVVARRQYDVAPLLPRSAPVWLQAANVLQYVDWQAAMGWGDGVMTSPARVLATLGWLALAWAGARALRRRAPELRLALVVLAACGTLGVATYLNLKAGASLGWGLLADAAPHEARERDYFFVLGFWAWGCFAGAGAVWLAQRLGRHAALAILAVALPVAGNWRAANRAREPEASAPRRFGLALLDAAPRDAVLFLDGDNDSYPIWYLQEVEGIRRDVLPVTVPLLPADWYPAQIARRSGLRWSDDPIPGVRALSELRAARIAGSAAAAGRPVAASPALPARERALLGADWVLRGPVYVAMAGGRGGVSARVDSAAARAWARGSPAWPSSARGAGGDDVARIMIRLLECPGALVRAEPSPVRRDSLEVRCNLR